MHNKSISIKYLNMITKTIEDRPRLTAYTSNSFFFCFVYDSSIACQKSNDVIKTCMMSSQGSEARGEHQNASYFSRFIHENGKKSRSALSSHSARATNTMSSAACVKFSHRFFTYGGVLCSTIGWRRRFSTFSATLYQHTQRFIHKILCLLSVELQ